MVKRNDNEPSMTRDEAAKHVADLNKGHKLDGIYEAHGAKFAVSVSPCSWMYPGYGLQVQYRSEDGRAWGYLNNKPLDQKDASCHDVLDLLTKGLTPGPCKKCKERTFYNPNGNRKTYCEQCFVSMLEARFAEEQEKEAALIAAEDENRKKEGYTHRVSAWIHPPRGDDYQVEFYFKGEPTKKDVEAVLRQEKSKRLDDYKVYTL